MGSRFDRIHDEAFHTLLAFLSWIPAVATNETPSGGFGSGQKDEGRWWVKLTIDIEHALAWSTVQELGHVLNYLSPDERLPTMFLPVSPPPYLNGGPEYLSWVIESTTAKFTPGQAAERLEGRIPNPVEDASAWPINQ